MSHVCPIEGNLINEPTVRVVAALVAITAALGIYFHDPIIFLFLTFDFYVRGFNQKKWSLFRYIGIETVNIFDVKEKLIDAGGKKFASRIGFVLSLILTITSFFQVPYVLLPLGGMLVLFATLESVLAFCVGCRIYTLYIRFL